MNFENSPFSILLFASTIIISLYILYLNQNLFIKWMLRPYEVYYNKKYYQLLTSGFLHADITHLIFNMLTFYFFGFQLESAIGSFNFFVIYFISMIAGNIFTVYQKKNDYEYASVGASGAISGILFSFILISPMSKLLIFPLPFPIPAWIFGILYLVWTYYSSRRTYDSINHTAHLYGGLAGLLSFIILEPKVIQIFLSYFF